MGVEHLLVIGAGKMAAKSQARMLCELAALPMARVGTMQTKVGEEEAAPKLDFQDICDTVEAWTDKQFIEFVGNAQNIKFE